LEKLKKNGLFSIVAFWFRKSEKNRATFDPTLRVEKVKKVLIEISKNVENQFSLIFINEILFLLFFSLERTPWYSDPNIEWHFILLLTKRESRRNFSWNLEKVWKSRICWFWLVEWFVCYFLSKKGPNWWWRTRCRSDPDVRLRISAIFHSNYESFWFWCRQSHSILLSDLRK